jgi:hypothetical protein
MSRYQILQSGGVFDFETRTIIPPDRSSALWQEYQNWLTAGNTPLPPDTIGQDDLATSKLKRQGEIDAYAAGLRNRVVRGRSAGEMASWALKLNEARAYTSTSDPLQAPTLSAIASIRGITLADLAGRVLANSKPFLQAEAAIDGIRGKHCDAIDAMTTVADIITYDWHSGWPVIP